MGWERGMLEKQSWVSWGYGLLLLLIFDLRCTSSILRWILDGSAQLFDLVDLTGSNSWKAIPATWSFGLPYLTASPLSVSRKHNAWWIFYGVLQGPQCWEYQWREAPVGKSQSRSLGLWSKAMPLIAKNYIHLEKQILCAFWARIGTPVECSIAETVNGTFWLVLVLRGKIFTISPLTIFPVWFL